jgi:hypothetical protein
MCDRRQRQESVRKYGASDGKYVWTQLEWREPGPGSRTKYGILKEKKKTVRGDR